MPLASWTVDRFAPRSFFPLPIFHGRLNVIGEEINYLDGFTTRPPAFQSTFYNTQGKNHVFVSGPNTSVSAGLFIPAAWADATQGSRRTDLWGVMNDGVIVSGFPIIGFTNYGGVPRYRVWNGHFGFWVDLATPVAYDTWSDFKIELTPTAFNFYIDGVLVNSQTGVEIEGSIAFQNVIIQSYNFTGDPSIVGAFAGNPLGNYISYWTNPFPEPEVSMLEFTTTDGRRIAVDPNSITLVMENPPTGAADLIAYRIHWDTLKSRMAANRVALDAAVAALVAVPSQANVAVINTVWLVLEGQLAGDEALVELDMSIVEIDPALVATRMATLRTVWNTYKTSVETERAIVNTQVTLLLADGAAPTPAHVASMDANRIVFETTESGSSAAEEVALSNVEADNSIFGPPVSTVSINTGEQLIVVPATYDEILAAIDAQLIHGGGFVDLILDTVITPGPGGIVTIQAAGVSHIRTNSDGGTRIFFWNGSVDVTESPAEVVADLMRAAAPLPGRRFIQ